MAESLDEEGNPKYFTPQKLEASTNLQDVLEKLRPEVLQRYYEHIATHDGQIVLEEP